MKTVLVSFVCLIVMASCYSSTGREYRDSQINGTDTDDMVELDVECPVCGDKECGLNIKWTPDFVPPPTECYLHFDQVCGFCGKDERCSIDGYCVPGGCMGECDEEIFVPAGLFCMHNWDTYPEGYPPIFDFCYGSNWSDEVWVDDFYIDKYEVTNRRYRRCVESGVCNEPMDYVEVIDGPTVRDYHTDTTYDNYPVIVERYSDIEKFCNWEGKRLPTEEEWLKAALGGCESMEHCDPRFDSKKYPWGNEEPVDCSRANVGYCVHFYQTVGAYPGGASPYGVMDTLGNAGEWFRSFVNEDDNSVYPYTSSNTGHAYVSLFETVYS
jgi:hypothetical protein